TVKGNLPTREHLKSNVIKLLAIACFFLAANYILFLMGLKLTSPANAQVLIQLAPVLLGFGSLIIFKERYTILQWVGVGILTLGFALFFNQKLNLLIDSSSEYLIGSGIIVIAAIAWAVYGLAQKQLLQQLSSSQIMLIIYGVCTLLFMPFSAPQTILNINFFHLIILIFTALNTVIAYGSFAESLQHWESSKISAVLGTVPIVTLLSIQVVSMFTNIIPVEKITYLGILGAILVVIGSVTIAATNKSRG
ncbi:MAG TPA: DMT family transporter, partial [Allocoleopsis sp.]